MLCLLVVIGGVVWIVQATEPPDGVIVDLDVPSDVRINDDLIIEITIQNTLQESRVLKEIEMDTTYSDGIFVHDSQPAFYDTWGGDDEVNYDFDVDIPPNQTTVIQLDATAVQAGMFTGLIEICIDRTLSCLEYPIRTRVRQQ